MNKKIIVVISILILIILAVLIYKTSNEPVTSNSVSTVDTTSETTETESNETKETNISAAFAIFTNGTFREFFASRYHFQSIDVFVETDTPNIVRVKKKGITWADFFATLPMKLDSKCIVTGTNQSFCDAQNGTLKFFINGELTPNALDREILNNDVLLVTFGNETQEQINDQLKRASEFL